MPTICEPPTTRHIRQEAHAGEIIQIPVEVPHLGGVVSGLVTLPCNKVGTWAEFNPAHHGGLQVVPSRCRTAHRACQNLLGEIGMELHGTLRLSPIHRGVVPGAGFGSSTSDIAAAFRIILDELGLSDALHADQLSRLAVAAEGASDPLFHKGEAVLFASRLGVVIEPLGGNLPPMRCLTFDLNAPRITRNIIRLEQQRGYETTHILQARDILETLRSAIAHGDARLLSEAAGASARLHHRTIGFPRYEEVERLSHRIGALGHCISHSGSVATYLFDPHFDELKNASRVVTTMLGVKECIAHDIL